jgi:two-component sensor histidine kinase
LATKTLTDSLRSFRARLLALSLGILLPAVICAGWLLWTQAAESNHQYEQQLLGTARALSSAVDQKISEAVAINETLATSARIPAKEFNRFRARSRNAVRGRSGWIVLSDYEGNQLVNTRLGPDAALPRRDFTPENIALARATGRSRLSDLTMGSVVRRPIIAVDTPIPTADETYNLSYIFEPSAFVPLFRDQQLSPGWLVALIDRKGRVIARSRGQDEFLGQPATGDIQATIRRAAEGVLISRTLDGAEVLTAFKRSSTTGWTLVTAVPRSQVQAAGARAITRAGVLALLLLVAGVLLAWALSRGLNRQVKLLVEDASAMAAGGVAPLRPGLMAELAKIQGAISRASHELAAREERHTLMVNELNHRVRNTLATVQALAAHSFREKAGPDEIAVFHGRLKGLSAARALLSEVNWTETSVAEVLRRCLPPSDERISLSGPTVAIAAHGGVALGMICHELTTNSLKYGALSSLHGRVAIEWSPEGENCRLVWREAGGPGLAAPTRKGFGSRLIERLAKQDLAGAAAFDYRPEGLVFTLTFSMGSEARWDPALHRGERRSPTAPG